MLNSICIWSGHISPYMISTPFHSHNFLNISRISARFSSKNTLRRYLGANTIWYLQFYFVCAKLFVLSVSFVILDSSVCVFLLVCQTNSIITQNGGSLFCSSVNLYWTPRLSRGFRDTKRAANLRLPLKCKSVHCSSAGVARSGIC